MSNALTRSRAALLILAVVAVLGASACLPEQHQRQSLDLINAARNARGLRDLTWDDESATKAQRWAERMASQYAISHSNLTDGISGNWSTLGENVGVGPSIEAVHAGFMNSQRHRDAILSGRYRSVGIGIAQSRGMVFIAQEFRG